MTNHQKKVRTLKRMSLMFVVLAALLSMSAALFLVGLLRLSEVVSLQERVVRTVLALLYLAYLAYGSSILKNSWDDYHEFRQVFKKFCENDQTKPH